MPMMRDYGLFEVRYRYETAKRIEDEIGELIGYGPKFFTEKVVRIVAPSEEMARAYVLSYQADGRFIVQVQQDEIDGVILAWSR